VRCYKVSKKLENSEIVKDSSFQSTKSNTVPQNCLQSKLGSNTKRKQDIINKSNQNENKNRIPYEYKVGDQVLLETPGILRKLPTPRT
jgi:hypothetical protein